MKKKLLSTAIAAVSLAGFSQGAFALNIATTQPDLEIFMSGASAQDGAITALFKNLCGVNAASNTLDIYRQGTNHTAYFCTLTAADVPGLSGPKNILFHKRSSGGSGQGVTPVLAQTPIQHLNINRTVNPCTAHATLAKEWVCTATTTDPTAYTSASFSILPRAFDLITKTSDSGISDVEPAMFKGVNKPNDAAADFADPAGVMTVKAGASLAFGVPVSDNLYVALQQAQGLLATSANSTGVNCTPGAYGKTGAFPVAGSTVYSEPTGDECMPSLTKNQIASLMAGQVKKWSELKVDHDNNTATLPVPLTDASIVSPGGVALAYNDYDFPTVGGAVVITPRTVAPTDASNNVRVCKRIEGSGTGAVAYANFLNTPCSTAGMTPEFATSPTGPVKHEVSGSGDMANCLEDWADGENVTKTITTTGNPDVFNTAMNTTLLKAWAIGHQSTENNAKHNRHYRFVKIDGVAPTVQNVFKGKYIDWAEATFQYNGSGVGAPAGDSKLIIDKVAADAASPAIIASDLNPNFIHAFGQGGYLASNKTNTYLATFNLASPVNAYSHAPGASAPSSCRVPVMPLPTTVAPVNAEKPF